MSGTNPKADFSDPLQIAVEVTAVKGTLALLTQQVSQGLGNVQSQLAALQSDNKEFGKQLGAVVSTQHEIQAHSTGLGRLADAIENLTAENHQWRRAHEAENRGVSDSVTSAKGAVKLIAWCGVFIVGLVVFTVQTQFNSASTERQRIELDHAADALRIERRIDKMDVEIDARIKRMQSVEQSVETLRERSNMKGLK